MTFPKPLGDVRDHLHLVRGMARVTGVELVRAYDQGDLNQAEWADIVTRCRSCEWADRCKTWLAAREDNSDILPCICRNSDSLGRLKEPV